MRLPRSIRWTCCANAEVLGALAGSAFGLRAVGPPQPAPIVNANHLRMLPEEANPNGNPAVFGLQGKEGFYAYRTISGPIRRANPTITTKIAISP